MPPTKRVNKKLLLETFAYICTHPGDWQQSAWRCRTGMCFAGHTVVSIQQKEPVVPPKLMDDRTVRALDLAELVYSRQGEGRLDGRVKVYEDAYPLPAELEKRKHLKVSTIADEATRALRLTDDQQRELFAANNGIDDLAAIIGGFIGTGIDGVVEQAKQIAKAEGWRWQAKKLRSLYGVKW